MGVGADWAATWTGASADENLAAWQAKWAQPLPPPDPFFPQAEPDPVDDPDASVDVPEFAPGDRGLAWACGQLRLAWFDNRETYDRILSNAGWPEEVGMIAGLARAEIGGDGLWEQGPEGRGVAVVPVFDVSGAGVVDLLALDLVERDLWWPATGLGLMLGRPWPSLGPGGSERPLRIMRHPRDWIEAGGWMGGPFQACCMLRLDAETRHQVLMQGVPSIAADDDAHAQELHGWIHKKVKAPPLPRLLVVDERAAA